MTLRRAVTVLAVAVLATAASCSSPPPPGPPPVTSGGPPGSAGPTTCAELAAFADALSNGEPHQLGPDDLAAVRRARAVVPPVQQAALDTIATAVQQVIDLPADDPEREARAIELIQASAVGDAFTVVVTYRLNQCEAPAPPTTPPAP